MTAAPPARTGPAGSLLSKVLRASPGSGVVATLQGLWARDRRAAMGGQAVYVLALVITDLQHRKSSSLGSYVPWWTGWKSSSVLNLLCDPGYLVQPP